MSNESKPFPVPKLEVVSCKVILVASRQPQRTWDLVVLIFDREFVYLHLEGLLRQSWKSVTWQCGIALGSTAFCKRMGDRSKISPLFIITDQITVCD